MIFTLQSIIFQIKHNLIFPKKFLIRIKPHNLELEEKHGTSFLDKNLRETFMWAAVNEPSTVDSLRKQYKLSEKQCWKWIVDALSEAGEWERLEHFDREHKSTYSPLALIKVFMKHGQKDRAIKLLGKVPPADQIAAYELIG